MAAEMNYPKRLIEVDLPIKRISAHARREKSIRHGHISTLHIWWARRPLAACRAVLCAALWPDPADPLCPRSFRVAAAKALNDFAFEVTRTEAVKKIVGEDALKWARFAEEKVNVDDPNHQNVLRNLLLDFIAAFAAWEASIEMHFLHTARTLTQAAHEALGGAPGTRPLVVDPFAGGGSIPLEALRIGADAFASDLNPVAVLLNKVVLEYIPKYGQRLADEVRKWGEWIKREAEMELTEFYPKDPDGATPIAYLWARTIKCEGPGCGAEVPLMRSLWLAKRGSRSVALRIVAQPVTKNVKFEIIENAKAANVGAGTITRSSATCPCCGFTTGANSVRAQLKAKRGGTADARLFAVVTLSENEMGRCIRLPLDSDLRAFEAASFQLRELSRSQPEGNSVIPDEPVNPLPHSVNRLTIYGMNTWGDMFTPRQSLALATLTRLIHTARQHLQSRMTPDLADAVQVSLGLTLDRVADRCSSLCRYDPSPTMSGINNTFARQALPMVWDFGEGDPKSERSGGWDQCLGWLIAVLEREAQAALIPGTVLRQTATSSSLPDDSVDAIVTDPPYYDMISYADLSDFFYVWLKRSLRGVSWGDTGMSLSPKADEVIVEPTAVEGVGVKDERFYLTNMSRALSEGRRELRPSGVGVVVFAHKTTTGWEALLQSLIGAGWIVTGSWPIDTEMANKVAGIGQARLMSSVHLVCRPRENSDGSVRADEVGDWRDVLAELPKRIHEWMPRLASEGVVGADAIFACLGPALEVFSRYSRVEKASGETVTLREYLEHVWGAVSREALSMIFEGADSTGFEEDARVTAMWLWTLGANDNNQEKAAADSSDEEEDEEETKGKGRMTGFVLEYDAARKIAQGLGAYLEKLDHVVQVKGDKARLLPVAERTGYLFGKEEAEAPHGRKKKKEAPLPTLLDAFVETPAEDPEGGWGEKNAPKPGATTLDRIHQSMILFAAGRGAALKRFLVEEGAGKDDRFWRLAQALAALYPPGTDERRWVEGVMARKKGLGF